MKCDHAADDETAAANCPVCQAARVQGLVTLQIADPGLWFYAETCAEGYLQQELRKLHTEVEHLLWTITR